MDTVAFRSVLILVENPNFGRERPYDLDVAGKSMRAWLETALGSPACVSAGLDDNIVPLVQHACDASAPYTVVLYSDTPLMTRATVCEAVREAQRSGEPVLRLTRGWVFETESLAKLTALPAVQRRYLTEEEDFMICADFASLALVTEAMRQRIRNHFMERGVHIVDPAATYIDGDVRIGKNVTIGPGARLRGHTVIGDGVSIEGESIITDCFIDSGARITSSNLNLSYIGHNTTVGPFAYVRPESRVGDDCRIGDFVELKHAVIGSGTKVSHLTYLGDCTLGSNCNVGCGVITANYDGTRKSETIVGDHVFIGSNVTLIAPITVGDGATLAAGGTFTDDVDGNALAIARSRQTVKPDRTIW